MNDEVGSVRLPASAEGYGEARRSALRARRRQPDRTGPPKGGHYGKGLGDPGGYTFIELLVVSAIILILASAVMPLAKVTATRQREAELRRDLREIRTAIDKYKDAADLGLISPLELKVGNEGYPASLETLVEGVAVPNDATGRKLKFLRRIPVDPMTHKTEWGLRSYQDEPNASRWGGQNVFDVYTTYEGTGLDGTKYRDW